MKGTRKFPFLKSAARASTAFSSGTSAAVAPVPLPTHETPGGAYYLQVHVHQANMLPHVGGHASGAGGVGATVRVTPLRRARAAPRFGVEPTAVASGHMEDGGLEPLEAEAGVTARAVKAAKSGSSGGIALLKKGAQHSVVWGNEGGAVT